MRRGIPARSRRNHFPIWRLRLASVSAPRQRIVEALTRAALTELPLVPFEGCALLLELARGVQLPHRATEMTPGLRIVTARVIARAIRPSGLAPMQPASAASFILLDELDDLLEVVIPRPDSIPANVIVVKVVLLTEHSAHA